MKNILLLSAGRRVELVRAFMEQVQARDLSSNVYATDIRPRLSAACLVADGAFTAPRVTDPSYIGFLRELCEKEEIRLLIPTIDTELLLLSRHRAEFERAGVHIAVSDESLVAECRDKRLTGALFGKLGIDSPMIYGEADASFPCFGKPFDGSCSVGAKLIENSDVLQQTLKQDPKLMVMEYIDRSHDEYTVDSYFDRTGVLRCLVPRLRLETRGGEVSKGVTRRNAVFDYLKNPLGKLEGARGCITLQMFWSPASGRFAAIEINPRFGGGFPLSYSAGANFPGWLIDEYLLGKPVADFDEWEENLLMTRYDAKVLVHGYE